MKLCVVAESGNCVFKLTIHWPSLSVYSAIPWGLTSLTVTIQHCGHIIPFGLLTKEIGLYIAGNNATKVEQK